MNHIKGERYYIANRDWFDIGVFTFLSLALLVMSVVAFRYGNVLMQLISPLMTLSGVWLFLFGLPGRKKIPNDMTSIDAVIESIGSFLLPLTRCLAYVTVTALVLLLILSSIGAID